MSAPRKVPVAGEWRENSDGSVTRYAWRRGRTIEAGSVPSWDFVPVRSVYQLYVCENPEGYCEGTWGYWIEDLETGTVVVTDAGHASKEQAREDGLQHLRRLEAGR